MALFVELYLLLITMNLNIYLQTNLVLLFDTFRESKLTKLFDLIYYILIIQPKKNKIRKTYVCNDRIKTGVC